MMLKKYLAEAQQHTFITLVQVTVSATRVPLLLILLTAREPRMPSLCVL